MFDSTVKLLAEKTRLLQEIDNYKKLISENSLTEEDLIIPDILLVNGVIITQDIGTKAIDETFENMNLTEKYMDKIADDWKKIDKINKKLKHRGVDKGNE